MIVATVIGMLTAKPPEVDVLVKVDGVLHEIERIELPYDSQPVIVVGKPLKQ